MRCDLFSLSSGNCLSVRGKIIDQNVNPILHGLGSAFERLRICHDSANENFLKAFVLHNPLIFRGRGDKNILTADYLECGDNLQLKKKIANLTFEQCFGHEGLLTRVEMRIINGIDISVSGYAKLGRALTHFVNRINANRFNDGSSTRLYEELNIKKPGPKIRKLLVKRRKKPFDISKQITTKTFFRITGIDYIGNDSYAEILPIWTWSGFSNRQKDFIFKYYNNLLGLNTRTWHFAANGTRNCTFCSLRNPPLQTDESFLHLFFLCPATRDWQSKFIQKCFPEMTLNTVATEKLLWFLGIYEDNFTSFVSSAILTFQYCIWKSKLRKKSPSFNTVYTEFLDNFKKTCVHNSDTRLSGSKINYTLCRIIFGGGGGQGVQDGEEKQRAAEGASPSGPHGGDCADCER